METRVYHILFKMAVLSVYFQLSVSEEDDEQIDDNSRRGQMTKQRKEG